MGGLCEICPPKVIFHIVRCAFPISILLRQIGYAAQRTVFRKFTVILRQAKIQDRKLIFQIMAVVFIAAPLRWVADRRLPLPRRRGVARPKSAPSRRSHFSVTANERQNQGVDPFFILYCFQICSCPPAALRIRGFHSFEVAAPLGLAKWVARVRGRFSVAAPQLLVSFCEAYFPHYAVHGYVCVHFVGHRARELHSPKVRATRCCRPIAQTWSSPPRRRAILSTNPEMCRWL
jgi:hypothetical protein